jgi:hypothetical protein
MKPSLQLKQLIFERYMKGDSLRTASREFDVSYDVAKNWYRKEKWKDQRKELELETQQNFLSQHRSLILKNRVDVTQRHLTLSKEIETAILQKIAVNPGEALKDFTTEQLLNLARAAKSATDVSARAVGLSDKIDPLQDGNGNIVIGAGAGGIINIGMKPEVIKPAKSIREVEVVKESEMFD